MYKIEVDAHSHTIFTRHAYSTIAENVAKAKNKGLLGLGMTDHFGLMLPWFYKERPYDFENHVKPSNLPKVMDGIRVYNGVEMDIIGFDGALAASDSLPASGDKHYMDYENFAQYLLAKKELVIASLHYFHGFKDEGVAQNTQMYINVVSTKGVDILGHPARAGVEFDIAAVVAAAKAHNTMVEVNNEDLSSRPHMAEVFMEVAKECARQGALICVNSDAHSCFNVGHVDEALAMLESINFPLELIANRTKQSFEEALRASGRQP